MRDVARRQDIKDLILDAADRFLNQFGYKKMTMDNLAREVGIAKGTLYLHFPSKEELVLAHIDRIVYRLLVNLQMIAHRDGSAAERLREMLLTRVLFRFDNVQHYTESLSDLLSDIRSSLLQRREKHFALEAKVFADVLEEGRKDGSFDAEEIQSTTNAILLATNSLLPYSLSANELGRRKELEKKISKIADLILIGLIKRS
ncbi:MAG TPA: TetR/AcrR family transcriptional regulator [Nitrososphaera sp.]|nr:TetR/AcrR family transcriptional regulator [Nitrososphaera sp.]